MATIHKPEQDLRQTQYNRVILMSVSAFVMNTTEFIPVALLSDIATDFSITTADAGWMLTIYAWVVALMSLPLMWFTRHLERKRLMLVLFGFFVASHILSAFAWRFEVLLLSRVGIAFSHALFWSITAAITLRLAPEGKKAMALSILTTGTAIAMVLGVPLGRLIGQWFGWRMTFGVIGIIAAVVLILQAKLLPALPSHFRGSLKKIPELLQNPLLVCLYLICFIAFTAHYSAYTYIEPYMSEVGGVSANWITIMLLLVGAAGIIGSMIYGYWGERHSTSLLFASITMMLLAMGTLLIAVSSLWALSINGMVWGVGVMLLVISIKHKTLMVDAQAQDMVMSMFSGIINLGIGAGALLGGYAVTTLSLSSVGFVGAGVSSIALILLVFMIRKFPQLS